ncbi:MAG: hypothetical protein LBK74_06790 [Treponema sp.]|jgi:hypothetical protein|nr:hypothetical protein [Treponema sp.]
MAYTFTRQGILRGGVFFLFFLILCAAGNAQNEGWRPIQPADNLLGAWEGTDILAIPKNEEAFIPDSSLTVTIRLVYARTGEQKTTTLVVGMNFEQLLIDWLAMPQVKEQGITKDQLWGLLVDQMQVMLPGVTFQGYSLSFEMSQADEFFGADDDSLEINRRRNKIRVTFPEPLSLGLGDEGLSQMVLTKKR